MDRRTECRPFRLELHAETVYFEREDCYRRFPVPWDVYSLRPDHISHLHLCATWPIGLPFLRSCLRRALSKCWGGLGTTKEVAIQSTWRLLCGSNRLYSQTLWICRTDHTSSLLSQFERVCRDKPSASYTFEARPELYTAFPLSRRCWALLSLPVSKFYSLEDGKA